MHSLSLPATALCGGGPVIFLGGKKSSKGDTVFRNGIILSQMPVLKKKTSPNSNRKLGCHQIHADSAKHPSLGRFRLKSTRNFADRHGTSVGSIREWKRQNTLVPCLSGMVWNWVA
jgi:hypothetical protein